LGAADARTILVVEDEPSISESIKYNLEREGFLVTLAADGPAALREFRASSPSLVLLDLMLPEMSGLDVCRIIRAESSVPIILLTAKDSETDKVVGLELGADDYVTKPFSMRELISRSRAQLRRATMSPGESDRDPSVVGGPVILNSDRHEVTVRGKPVTMTPKEFAVLELLIARKGRLLTREFLIDEIWGPDYYGDTKTLDVHIKRVREKVETDPRNPEYICTVRGLGYKFQEPLK